MNSTTLAPITSIAQQAQAILRLKDKPDEINYIQDQLHALTSERTSILICGEFKRGKSTFINAFLEQQLCPTDVDIATSAISIIKYGARDKVTRQYGDIHKLKSKTYDSLDAIAHYATGSTDDTAILIIETPNPKLQHGLILIDSPGLGGLDPRHAFLTNYILPSCHIVFFLTDSSEPITESEARYYREKISRHARESAIIINKSDLFRDSSERDQYIADTLQKCADASSPPTVIALSARLKQRYLTTGRDAHYQQSNFAPLEQLIERLVTQHQRKHVTTLCHHLIQTMEEMITPIRLQLEQIKTPDPQIIRELEREIAQCEQYRDELDSPTSDITLMIKSTIINAKTDANALLTRQSIKLRADTHELLASDPAFRSSEGTIRSHLQNHLCAIASEIDLCLSHATRDILARLQCSEMQPSPQIAFSCDHLQIIYTRKPLTAHTNTMVKSLVSGIGIASGIGTGILATSIFAFPLIIPLVAGVVLAGHQFHSARQSEIIATLQQQVRDQMTIATTDLQSYIARRYSELEDTVQRALKESNDSTLQRMIHNQALLSNLVRDTEEQTRKKQQLLTTELPPLETLVTQCQQLITRISTSSSDL